MLLMEVKLILTRLWPSKLSYLLAAFLHHKILFLRDTVSVDLFQTLCTY